MNSKFVKFLISGVSAATAEYGVFLILSLSIGSTFLLVINGISFCAGLCVSFFLNRRWVFGSSEKIGSQFVKYAALACINLILSTGIFAIFVYWLDISEFYAKIFVMVMIAMWNFLIFKTFIFKQSQKN